MIEYPLLISVLTALAVTIAWHIIVFLRNSKSVDKEISSLKITQESKNAAFDLKHEEHEKRHNKMVLDVVTIQRELSEKIERQNSVNLKMQEVMHQLQITLVKLDTTLTHFDKLLNKFDDELESVKGKIEELKYKK